MPIFLLNLLRLSEIKLIHFICKFYNFNTEQIKIILVFEYKN